MAATTHLASTETQMEERSPSLTGVPGSSCSYPDEGHSLYRPLASFAYKKETLLGYGSKAPKGIGLWVREEQHPTFRNQRSVALRTYLSPWLLPGL